MVIGNLIVNIENRKLFRNEVRWQLCESSKYKSSVPCAKKIMC